MAGSLNKVMLIGNLGKDPEVRRLNNGNPVVNMRIATSESWRDKNSGERQERTEWHSIVIFNEQLAGVAEKYLRKGSKVYLEGQLQTRKWTDQAGVERYSTEIVLQAFNSKLVLLDGKDDGEKGERRSGNDQTDFGRGGNAYEQAKSGGTSGGGTRGGRGSDLDDEIPF